MASLYSLKDRNVFKSMLLMAFLFALVAGSGWALSWYFGSYLIFVIAVILAVAGNAYSFWFAHRGVLRVTGAKELVRSRETEEIYDIVENLSIQAGIPIPKIYIVEDPSLNAFATGRDPEHGIVAVTRGLLDALEKTELEGVIAHEISHIKNRDTLIMTIVFVLAGVIALIADFALRMSIFSNSDNRNPLMLVFLIVGALLAPLAATLIRLGVSRKREYLADASAALTTRYPEGLASALEKIQHQAVPLRRKGHGVAHFFINDPYKGMVQGKKQKTSFFQRLFSTHPPIEDRIQKLRQSI